MGIAVVLNPRYKIKLIELYFPKIYHLFKLVGILPLFEKLLYALFYEYANTTSLVDVSTITSSSSKYDVGDVSKSDQI